MPLGARRQPRPWSSPGSPNRGYSALASANAVISFDAVALERERPDRRRQIRAALLVEDVPRDRRLPAGALMTWRRTGLNCAMNATTSSRPPNQHGNGGIAKVASTHEHRHHRVDVAALPRGDVALDTRAGRRRRARGRLLLAALGQYVVDGLPRPLESAVDRRGGRVERLRDLARREPEHFPQDQHRPLARGQMLERHDERELDALPLLVPRLGRGMAVLEARCSSG